MQTCHTASADSPVAEFYLDTLLRLGAAGVPFMVGGAFAFTRYASMHRDTKDLDLFVRPEDVPRLLNLMHSAGYRTELTFPHWLGKIHEGENFVDIIFSSGNGVARVDDRWFEHEVEGEVLGEPVKLCPPEEMIWSKAFIQERERFDGADVLHLFSALGASLDWPRILERFGEDWPVLFGHVVLFGYVYPDRRDAIPDWVVRELTSRFASAREPRSPSTRESRSHVCRGTLLSREQYLWDLDRHGYQDARLQPHGAMTPEEIAIWTAAIGGHSG
jgi:hypothetical protein